MPMIKNLVCAALGLGGVALATTLVLTTSSETPTSCKVRLDANGGTFTLLETNVYDTVVAYSNKFGTVFNEETAVENPNFDLLGWTNALGVVSNDYPVLSDMTCYAKWERSAIQKFTLVNGRFEGTAEGSDYVAQFPAAFYGTATIAETNGHYICFAAPTSGMFRISFDPQIGWKRIYAKIGVVHNGVTNEFEYGTAANPVVFEEQRYTFVKGDRYEILLSFTGGVSQWGDIQARYVFGIGLDGNAVRFDVGEYGAITYSPDKFKDPGANFSTNLPFGYLPTTKAVNSSVSFLGWYSEKRGGVKIETTTLVGTNDIYYAHWKLPTYNYYVTFAKSGFDEEIGMVQGRQMPKQTFTSGVAQSLSNNRYYMSQHKFMGWATEPKSTKVVYSDGQSVTDICDVPEGTCPLYAVWLHTPSENHFTVSSAVTNFLDVAVSTNITTFVAVPGSVPNFTMSVTNMTPSELRVSLDPATGSNRTGAILHVDRQYPGGWSNDVCKVSDLSTNAVVYAFEKANYCFRITGADAASSYSVGLGAKGARIDFDPCGENYVNASTLSSSLTFDWTEASPYGYTPTLTSGEYGTFLGWYKSKDLAVTNDQVTATNVVTGAETVFAHWANQPYFVAFDGSGATSPTNSYVQQLYYDRPQALERNRYSKPESRFLGWATKGGDKVVYEDGQVVSNLCTIVGETNTLHAVWESTPGTNWYYVAGGVTNFGTIAVSQGNPTLFVGKGDVTQFYIASASANNCRVAIDPDLGYGRTDALLTVFERRTETNKWETACEVSELSEKEVKCSFKGGYQYKFDVSNVGTNGYVVSIGAEGARYIFDVCGGDFVGEKDTTKVKFYNWTVGSAIAYTPPVTTNAYVHGTNTWHYTPQYLTKAQEKELGIKQFSTTNLVVTGGEKIYAHWSDAVIVDLVFDWNLATTNVVFTNYYGQGSTVYLYNDDYVRQPSQDDLGFLGWTTNQTGTAGYDLTSFTVSTNSTKNYYAQWTDEWKTSRTSDGSGLSVDGSFKAIGATLEIPTLVTMLGGTVKWPVKVVAIGDSAFRGCANFKVLTVPAGVADVGDSAFEDCSSLTRATFEPAEMPAESTEIGEGGFLDGIVEDGTPSVELGECLFKGCTSLKDVALPLGINCIPNECFSGCTAMTSFGEMPYTVIEIGSEAFYGCTHLTNVVCTEIVDKIGEGAFRKCARLKFVSFIGNPPDEIEDDIFNGTPRNVLVRYLPNMCANAKEYCGGTWPELPSLWPEAGNTNSSRTLTWLGGRYPRRKVIFNYNDNPTLWKSNQDVALYHSGRVFGLQAPREVDTGGEEEESASGFTGWYTRPVGGRRVGDYWVVPTASEGDSAAITVYAHWGDEEGEGFETGSRGYGVYFGQDQNTEGIEDFPGFYSVDNDDEGITGDDMFYYSASTFNGIVIDGTDVDSCTITGTVQFVIQEGTCPKDGGMQSAFTATVTWNSGKTTTISGVVDAEGYLVAKSGTWSFGEEGDDHRTVITKSGLNGWLSNEESEFRIYAARNRYAMSNEASKGVVLTGLQATKGTWHVVLATAAADGEGEEFAKGYTTFSIAISGMGQAAITGMLGDGTQVSTTSTLIVGDGCCCLPVNVRPYAGQGGFAFMIWFTWKYDGSFAAEDVTIQCLTGWDASMSAHPFTATFEHEDLPVTFIDDQLYSGEADFKANEELLTTITMEGKTWKVAESESNLKLTYDHKTGIFTGSFVVETEDKRARATVSGVFTDRLETDDEGKLVSETYTGYGTALIPGVETVPVTIETTPIK